VWGNGVSFYLFAEKQRRMNHAVIGNPADSVVSSQPAGFLICSWSAIYLPGVQAQQSFDAPLYWSC